MRDDCIEWLDYVDSLHKERIGTELISEEIRKVFKDAPFLQRAIAHSVCGMDTAVRDRIAVDRELFEAVFKVAYDTYSSLACELI